MRSIAIGNVAWNEKKSYKQMMWLWCGCHSAAHELLILINFSVCTFYFKSIPWPYIPIRSDSKSFSRCLWYFLANFIHWNKKCSFPFFTSLPINWAISFIFDDKSAVFVYDFPRSGLCLFWQHAFFSLLEQKNVCLNTTSPVVLFDQKP